MKKKIISCVLASALLVTIGFGVNKNMSRTELNNMVLSNIEALAEDETVSGMIECNGSGSLYCYLTNKCEYSEILIYQ